MGLNKVILFPLRVSRHIWTKRKALWKHLDMDSIALRGYKGFSDSTAFKGCLEKMLGNFDKELFDNVDDNCRGVIIASAQQAFRHEFDLLGSGPTCLDRINWHIDFKSGKSWSKSFYLELAKPQSADVKIPWELSRCQHLLWLGEAYIITSDTKYAQEVIDEINWWIDDNPFLYSINWKCAMDVAFRAVNWIFALNMIADYEGFNDVFAYKVSQSLWQHAFFIRNNLERQYPYSNNHYFADIVGLLYLGALFSGTSRGKVWMRFALKEFYSETRKQVLPSGIHFERSVSYHRMMTELVSYPVYMLRRTDKDIPSDIIERIQGMYAYVAAYTKPSSLSPLIADNDNGRFVPFVQRDFCYHNYLNDPDSVENIFVAAGLRPLFCQNVAGTHLYDDAGVAVVHMNNNYLFINNGGYSKHPEESQMLIGTHTHNDLLSFDLSLAGKDVIVDPGTYLYTSSKTDRDAFRSTAKHNTVQVDNEEQNEMAAPFYLIRNVRIGKLVEMDGGYEGVYQTIKGQLEHRRKFTLTQDGLTITDHLNKQGPDHIANLFFHFAPGLTPIAEDGSVKLDECGVIVSFSEKPDSQKIIDDTVSPSFGVLLPAKTLVATYHFSNEITIHICIKSLT